MERRKLIIGIFGFGCVGQGFYTLLQKSENRDIKVKKICIKNLNKKRPFNSTLFTDNHSSILEDPTINTIVEVTNDPCAALVVIRNALKKGMAVISANKKIIAENLPEFYELQLLHGGVLLYESSSCASIPIIRTLEEYYKNGLVKSVKGILNGSSNFILSNVFNGGMSYNSALKLAQDKGFAESDPLLDVGGFDARNKLCILLTHAFGLFVNPSKIFRFGIERINELDIQFANENGLKIKQLAFCKKNDSSIHALVAPHFVNKDNSFYGIENEWNAVMVDNDLAGNQLFVGKGAGSYPTGDAVLSDVCSLQYGYKYRYSNVFKKSNLFLDDDFNLKVYLRVKKNYKKISTHLFKVDDLKWVNGNAVITGNMNIKSLQNAKWLNDKDVSLIVFNEA